MKGAVFAHIFLLSILILGCGNKGMINETLNFNNSLIAYYPFNGNSNDESEFDNHGQVYGATLTQSRNGDEASAYFFDGNDYIDTYTTFDIPIRTISIWFRVDSEDIETISEQTIFDQDSHELSYGVWRISIDNGRFSMLEGGGEARLNLFNVIESGEWNNAVVVRGNSDIRYYLNGNLVGLTSIDRVGSSSSAYEYLVFGTNRERHRKFFFGAIDDIRIYNSALTEDQVLQLYNE